MHKHLRQAVIALSAIAAVCIVCAFSQQIRNEQGYRNIASLLSRIAELYASHEQKSNTEWNIPEPPHGSPPEQAHTVSEALSEADAAAAAARLLVHASTFVRRLTIIRKGRLPLNHK